MQSEADTERGLNAWTYPNDHNSCKKSSFQQEMRDFSRGLLPYKSEQ